MYKWTTDYFDAAHPRRQEIKSWCNQAIGSDLWFTEYKVSGDDSIRPHGSSRPQLVYYFYRKEDFEAFRLIWGIDTD